MISGIWMWFKGLWISKKVGILIATILAKSAVPVIAEILDPENQKKAYEFVKKLHNDKTLTNHQKAREFNKMMFKWAKKMGRKFTENVVNCLRELAVATLKAEAAPKEIENKDDEAGEVEKEKKALSRRAPRRRASSRHPRKKS